MNRKTIYYIKDEGTKKNIISLPSAQAEKHFKMGVAIEIDPKAWALPPELCMSHAEAELQKFLNKERGIRLTDKVAPSVMDVASNYGKVMGGNIVVPPGIGSVPKSIQRKNREVFGISPLLETLLKMNDVKEIHDTIRKALGK